MLPLPLLLSRLVSTDPFKIDRVNLSVKWDCHAPPLGTAFNRMIARHSQP
ncbi:hypothetical protein MYAER_1263 [Microcystis aeruginosa NIES-2549]|uniref:Uncharacterized protein n=1 Tax=Microcystis aeruginosa NIES-2549 TaxID=1641812 RepID=A0A0F6U2Y6_MICAE|nr:hypothetical protein MYAER_1263 [Microcystis aeruginosa NIES-2549]